MVAQTFALEIFFSAFLRCCFTEFLMLSLVHVQCIDSMLSQEIPNLVRTSQTRLATLGIVTLFVLIQFDAIYDLFPNRRTTTWDMFALYDKEAIPF